jgi:hypothetical protein
MLRILTGNYYSAIRHEVTNKKGFTLSQGYFNGFDRYIGTGYPTTIMVDRPGTILSELEQFNIGLDLCEVPNDLTIFTHSSALINGVRVGVKRGITSSDQVIVVFYSNKREAIELHMNHKGLFYKHFPDGFMDTWDKALEELLED